jgi:hypothetical protein
MECPLGYECKMMATITENEDGTSECENEESCKHFTLS